MKLNYYGWVVSDLPNNAMIPGDLLFLKNGQVEIIVSESKTFVLHVDHKASPHREDGPAFAKYDLPVSVSENGYCPDPMGKILQYKYFKHGVLHRLDGPARNRQIDESTVIDYFVNGLEISPVDYENIPEVKRERIKNKLKSLR